MLAMQWHSSLNVLDGIQETSTGRYGSATFRDPSDMCLQRITSSDRSYIRHVTMDIYRYTIAWEMPHSFFQYPSDLPSGSCRIVTAP